jgi:hypothetical protein
MCGCFAAAAVLAAAAATVNNPPSIVRHGGVRSHQAPAVYRKA